MTNHTKEPWSVKPGPKIIGNGEDLLGMPIDVARLNLTVGHYESEEANARRIVACVNACKGLPTKELEELGIVGVVGRELIDLDAKLAAITAQRDELLKALKMARIDIIHGNDVFLSESLEREFLEKVAEYDSLIAKCEVQNV